MSRESAGPLDLSSGKELGARWIEIRGMLFFFPAVGYSECTCLSARKRHASQMNMDLVPVQLLPAFAQVGMRVKIPLSPK